MKRKIERFLRLVRRAREREKREGLQAIRKNRIYFKKRLFQKW